MRTQLGTHCPECGTTDPPCLTIWSDTLVIMCMRCGRSSTSGIKTLVLEEFYGDAATREPSGIEIAAVLAAKLGRDYAKDPESPISTLDPDWWMKWATGQVKSAIKRRNKS